MARRDRVVRGVRFVALVALVAAMLAPSLVPLAAEARHGGFGAPSQNAGRPNFGQGEVQVQRGSRSASAAAQDAAQGPRFPLEIEVGGERFSFDRIVPTDATSLREVDQIGERTVLAERRNGPFDRIYVSAPPRPENLGRYLPQNPASGACPAADLVIENIDTGEALYTFAGLEADVTPDGLTPAFQTQAGETVYADGGQAPAGELFAETANGLERYVVLGQDGRPATLRDALEFGGQRFAYGGEVGASIDPGSLNSVGCAGPFEVATDSGASEPPFDTLFVSVGAGVFSYTAIPTDQSGETDDANGSPAGQAPDETADDDEAAQDDATDAEGTGEADIGAPAIVPGEGDATADAEATAVDEDEATLEDEATSEETAESEATVESDDAEDGIETVEADTDADSVIVDEATETAEADATEVLLETVEADTTEVPAEADDADDATTSDPGAFPREIVVDEARFVRDRVVPIAVEELSEVGESAGFPVYAAAADGPFDRVYAAAEDGAAEAARYLAELPLDSQGVASPDALCLAEDAAFFPLTFGEVSYAVAGIEPDLTADDLQEIAQTGAGEPIYAETTEAPFPELFFAVDGALYRFVLTDDQGIPTNLGTEVDFDGQTFAFETDVTGDVDPEALTRVGCVGPYSARAGGESADDAPRRLYVVLVDETPTVLAFAAEGGPPPDAGVDDEDATAPAEAPTEPSDPTETPEPATPTAEPEPEPTETAVPTETPVPPTATPEPTMTPEPTATPESTETPAIPTETPAPTETAVPPTETALPTETAVPTGVPVSTPEPEPTEPTQPTEPAATDEATVSVEPAETEEAAAISDADSQATTIAAAPDVIVTPTPVPTVAPPDEPMSPIAVDAPAPILPSFPREIQVQGVRYLFDLEVDVDPSTLVQVDTLQAPGTALSIFAEPPTQASALRASFAQTAVVGPFVRVYAFASATLVARYLPQAPITASGAIDLDTPCLAESSAATFSYTFEQEQYSYSFASVETQVSVEALRTSTVAAVGNVPTTDDGREILLRGGPIGFSEVFLAGDTLERYVALNAVGVPVTLNNLVFAETRFSYRSEVSVSIEQAGLRRVGCAGVYPIYAPPPQAEGRARLATCYAVVNNRVYEFEATAVSRAVVATAPPPPAVAAPPPGVVQVVFVQQQQQQQQQIQAPPTPTPLPNVRLIPVPPVTGQAPIPTPVTGVVAVRPVVPRDCPGDPGELGDDGLPTRLPARIQLSGVAYRFAETVDVGGDLQLARIGCVGPFEAAQAQGEDVLQVLYLRTSRFSETLFRYEAATSFGVQYVVTGSAQVITAGDQTYVLDETWQRSVYSSYTNILYAQDPETLDPPRLFGDPVDGDVIAEYAPEGGDVVEPPEELRAAAAEVGINPDLVLGGQRRYLLVNLWRPIGTTTNGWVTLYSSVGEGVADTVLATDPRSLDLLIYRSSGG